MSALLLCVIACLIGSVSTEPCVSSYHHMSTVSYKWAGLCRDLPECAAGGCGSAISGISETETSPTSYSSCKSTCEADADCTGFSHHSNDLCKTHHGAQVQWAQSTYLLYTCYQLSRSSGCTACSTANTSAWDCSPGSQTVMPIQSMRCYKNQQPYCYGNAPSSHGYGFFALNIHTGVYSALFSIPDGDVFSTSGDWLNACGINPVDSRAYCVVSVKDVSVTSPLLIRLGSAHANPEAASFEYVAKLRAGASGLGPNTAAFSASGNFHFLYPNHNPTGTTGELNIIDGVNMPHLLDGFCDFNAQDLTDLRSTSPVDSMPYRFADVAITTIGGLEYGVLVQQTAQKIIVYRPPQTVDSQSYAWDLKLYTAITSAGSPDIQNWAGGWGSMWNYQGTFYAAGNGGFCSFIYTV